MTLPRVHAITERRVLTAPALQATVLALAQHGPALALHVRDRTATARELAAHAIAISAWLDGCGVQVFVNSRPDIARAIGARGVQLGQHDLAPTDARIVLGAGWIGVSLHSMHALAGVRDADYAMLGPVFPTATHPGAPALGTGPLPAAHIHVIAIGGITLERVPAVRQAGYHGVAAIRAIWDAPAPGDVVARMLEELA